MQAWPIDNAQCQDVRLVGAKAAQLAKARARGLPVPESMVIPCAASEPVLAAAASMIDTRGVHFGRFEVLASDRRQFDPLAAAVAVLGEPLAVRSSSPLEDDPRLAGAFTSFLGVSPAELSTAILGVWSSALHKPFDDEHAADPPLPGLGTHAASDTVMGVIIQRDLTPRFAGTATVSDGAVRVVAVAGSAAALMAGWSSGVTAIVHDNGEVEAAGAAEALRDVAIEAAAVARETHAALGDTLVEWAYSEGKVWLLQSRLAATSARAASRIVPAHAEPRADVQHLLTAGRRVGELAERWWLPWALGGDGHAEDTPPSAAELDDPIGVWRRFVRTADTLTHSVWSGSVDPAAVSARVRAALHDGTDLATLAGDLRQPDGTLVAAFDRLSAALIDHLLARGLIDSPFDFWALPSDLEAALDTGHGIDNPSMRTRRAALKWEAVIYGAVIASGDERVGTPLSDGMGCGRAAVVDVFGFESTIEAQGLRPRSILVASRPLPRYAPLLMGAAGLVTAGGSEAAHLIEVARTLGIPSVTHCPIEGIHDNGHSYVAIDGTSGTVHVLNSRQPAGSLL